MTFDYWWSKVNPKNHESIGEKTKNMNSTKNNKR